MISLWGKEYRLRSARQQARILGLKFVAVTSFLGIIKDGKVTRKDAPAVATGIISSLMIIFEEPLERFLSKRGIFVAANSLLNQLTYIYLIGLGFSFAIDPEEGIENYNQFIFEAEGLDEKALLFSWSLATLLQKNDQFESAGSKRFRSPEGQEQTEALRRLYMQSYVPNSYRV